MNIDLVQWGDETRADEHMWLDDQEPWVVRTEKTAIPSQCVQYCVESKRRKWIICSCGWFCIIGKLAALFWVVPLMVVSPRSEELVSLVYPGWLAFLVNLCHVLSQMFQEEDEVILQKKSKDPFVGCVSNGIIFERVSLISKDWVDRNCLTRGCQPIFRSLFLTSMCWTLLNCLKVYSSIESQLSFNGI